LFRLQASRVLPFVWSQAYIGNSRVCGGPRYSFSASSPVGIIAANCTACVVGCTTRFGAHRAASRSMASVMRRLVLQGVLVQEQDQWYVADGVYEDTDASALRPLQQGSIVYRIALGPKAGRKVLTLREALP
jgi:hypothetical protein